MKNHIELEEAIDRLHAVNYMLQKVVKKHDYWRKLLKKYPYDSCIKNKSVKQLNRYNALYVRLYSTLNNEKKKLNKLI